MVVSRDRKHAGRSEEEVVVRHKRDESYGQQGQKASSKM